MLIFFVQLYNICLYFFLFLNFSYAVNKKINIFI